MSSLQSRSIEQMIFKSRSELSRRSTCCLSMLTTLFLSWPIGRSPFCRHVHAWFIIRERKDGALSLSCLSELASRVWAKLRVSVASVNHFCSTRNDDGRAKLDRDRLASNNRSNCSHACISPRMRYVIPLSCTKQRAVDRSSPFKPPRDKSLSKKCGIKKNNILVFMHVSLLPFVLRLC